MAATGTKGYPYAGFGANVVRTTARALLAEQLVNPAQRRGD